MWKYIEAGVAFDVLSEYYHHRTQIQHHALREALDRVPAADVTEVKHGRWIVAETEYAWNCAEYPASYKCSKCGYIAKAGLEDNYCPHCGAKMDKEE